MRMTKQEFGVLDRPVNPLGEAIVTWPAKDEYKKPHRERKVLTLPVNHAGGERGENDQEQATDAKPVRAGYP